MAFFDVSAPIGLRGIQAASGMDAAQLYIDYAMERV